MLTRVDASLATFNLWSSWQLGLMAFSCTVERSFTLCARLDLCLRTPGTFRPHAKHFLACEGIMSLKSHLEGPLEVAFAWRWRFSPNSSPLEAKLKPKSRSCNSWWTLHQKSHPCELGLRQSFSLLSLYFAKKGLHVISSDNRLRWLHGDFSVQAWRFLGAVLFEVCYYPWFNDVVLYFWFHTF
jgi:hypothetical protein